MQSSGLLASLAAGLLFSQTPALAGTPGSSSAKGKDLNEKVCEDITVVGSRLAVRRVCGTRAEWEERRRLDKEAIDRAQMSPNGPCRTINTRTGAIGC